MAPPPPVPNLELLFTEYLEEQRSDEVTAQLEKRQIGAEVAKNLYVKGYDEANAVDRSDVVQSLHTDCFLMAAMSALAGAHPDPDRWMRDMIKPREDGSFDVTLYKPQPGGGLSPTTVNVGPLFSQPAQSDDGQGTETWQAVIEKAYSEAYPGGAKNDSYGFNGGNSRTAMEALTGVPGWSLDPRSTTLDTLADYQRKGYAITVGTYGATFMGPPAPPADKLPEYAPGGLNVYNSPFTRPQTGSPVVPASHATNDRLHPYHAYYVSKVDAATGMVTVHNVWDLGRQDILIPYDRFQVAFSNVEVHPVQARERPH